MIQSMEVRAAVQEITRRILKDKAGVELQDGTRFKEDLGADSLCVVELMYEVEQTFDVKIPDEDVPKLRTFGDVVGYLEKAIKAKA
jgi:acyl carrier protein